MPAPSDARSPSVIAIERLAKMAAQGAATAKMLGALDEVLIRWGEEELEPDDLRERIETLQTDLDAGAQAAEEYVMEAETAAARTAAQKQLEGLAAVRDRLSAIVAG